MKRMLSISLLMILCLTASLVFSSAVEGYSDIQGHWGQKSIERWSGYGIVQGDKGKFYPDKNMTRAQAATVYTNLLGLEEKADLSGFTDVGKGMWYDEAIAKCVKAGIMKGVSATKADPNGTITREMFFVMYARALGIAEEASLNKTMSDSANVSSWAKGYVNALINAGYVSGVTDDSIAPAMNINRASVMALLDKSIVGYANKGGTIEAAKDGIVLIATKEPVSIKSASALKVIVVKENAKISLADATGNVTVNVEAANVDISGAKVGTVVNADKNTKVNDNIVTNNTKIIVEEKKIEAGGGGGGGSAIHNHSYVTTTPASCTTDGVETCLCGISRTIPAKGHDWSQGKTCSNCGERIDDAQKFVLQVTSANKTVSMGVFNDYSVIIEVPNATVDASNVSVYASMQNVASLGVSELREHTLTIADTGMTGTPNLYSWLSNAWDFGVIGNENNGIINVKVGDKSCTYKIFNTASTTSTTDAEIWAKPVDIQSAREAWQELASHVETSTGADDSKVTIANGSYLRNGTEKLEFEAKPGNDLVLDNFSNLTGIKTTVKDAVKLTEATGSNIEAYLAAGSKLQVGSSIATLSDNATITVDTVIEGALDGIRTASNSDGNYALAQEIVQLVNDLMNEVQGKTININVSFSEIDI